MAVPDLVTNWVFYLGAGSTMAGVVGFGIGLGKTMAKQATADKNITALWAQKQDVNVCDTEHKHVTLTLNEIKEDVKEILRIKRNGGG